MPMFMGLMAGMAPMVGRPAGNCKGNRVGSDWCECKWSDTRTVFAASHAVARLQGGAQELLSRARRGQHAREHREGQQGPRGEDGRRGGGGRGGAHRGGGGRRGRGRRRREGLWQRRRRVRHGLRAPGAPIRLGMVRSGNQEDKGSIAVSALPQRAGKRENRTHSHARDPSALSKRQRRQRCAPLRKPPTPYVATCLPRRPKDRGEGLPGSMGGVRRQRWRNRGSARTNGASATGRAEPQCLGIPRTSKWEATVTSGVSAAPGRPPATPAEGTYPPARVPEPWTGAAKVVRAAVRLRRVKTRQELLSRAGVRGRARGDLPGRQWARER